MTGASMTMIDDWRTVAKKAWSMRLIFACAALSGMEAALPMLAGWMPSGVLAGLSCMTAIAAVVARVIMQKELHND